MICTVFNNFKKLGSKSVSNKYLHFEIKHNNCLLDRCNFSPSTDAYRAGVGKKRDIDILNVFIMPNKYKIKTIIHSL